MKNWYGSLGGRRNRLHQNIDTSVADLAVHAPDAHRRRRRPRSPATAPPGGNVDDTRRMNTVVATIDQVAADAYGCTLIGQRPRTSPTSHGRECRLGTMPTGVNRLPEIALDAHDAAERFASTCPTSPTPSRWRARHPRAPGDPA